MKRQRARESDQNDSQAWYVAEGKRGQQLLDHGHVGQATEVFEAILARLGEAPSYGRAVILGRLGRCIHMSGRPDLAVRHLRDALDVIGRLTPSDGVKALRATLRSELGDALRAGGQYAEARKAYEAALKIAEELNDLRAQGVELGRLGALALTEGKAGRGAGAPAGGAAAVSAAPRARHGGGHLASARQGLPRPPAVG